MKPYAHQEKFSKDYTGPNIIVHDAGTGKTICACLWLKDSRDSDALVVCPKRVCGKWSETLVRWGTKATVVSKEQFKKLPPKAWSALIVDEVDEFSSPLFLKGRSQLSTCLYILLKQYPHMPRLLLSATPIRSTPWNFHTILTFSGHYIDWKEWRNEFFELTRRPFLQYLAWLPKEDWRKKVRPYLEKYCDIVLLRDCVEEMPPIEEETIRIKSEPFKKDPEWEPSKAFSNEHQHEQKAKIAEIKTIAKGYRKVVVVTYYVDQIEELQKELSKTRETFTVYGKTKNQEQMIKAAQESVECFLIIQASLNAGFDLDSFSCMIFASMSYAVRDYIQMKGRVTRRHNLHAVKYIYLIGGRCDRQVLKNIELGKDFVPSTWSDTIDE